MCVNGAAARLVQPGDIVIILSYVHVDAREAEQHRPNIVLMGVNNRIDEVIGYEPEATIY
ncbi:Aspartate decarboxylase [Bhargavaea beijingensis]|uniref:Aspartate decarboxylase n=1 Tax=Bhargavaea beijingensis TaxID=426756 RepID=A0A1G7AJQ6_9BACL|nr:aspartate 1-decarboxylase [Bhargavaea beijingensis]SDE15012.1 Aspartate decarboxylase [Bhargavaea beijingensis]